jgi:hypothetical protein
MVNGQLINKESALICVDVFSHVSNSVVCVCSDARHSNSIKHF